MSRATRDQMLLAEHRKLARLVVEYAEGLGGIQVLSGAHAQYADGHDVETAAGTMRMQYVVSTRGFLHCRFDEPERANICYYGSETMPSCWSGRLSQFSGKFNFHFGRTTAAKAMDDVRRELSPFLLCPITPTKEA